MWRDWRKPRSGAGEEDYAQDKQLDNMCSAGHEVLCRSAKHNLVKTAIPQSLRDNTAEECVGKNKRIQDGARQRCEMS